jgi:hypothetical protein
MNQVLLNLTMNPASGSSEVIGTIRSIFHVLYPSALAYLQYYNSSNGSEPSIELLLAQFTVSLFGGIEERLRKKYLECLIPVLCSVLLRYDMANPNFDVSAPNVIISFIGNSLTQLARVSADHFRDIVGSKLNNDEKIALQNTMRLVIQQQQAQNAGGGSMASDTSGRSALKKIDVSKFKAK